jgi:molecular chaperone DnaK
MLSKKFRYITEKNSLQKQQRREILPLIGIGIGIFAVGTAAQYVFRTLNRLEEEKKNGGGGGDGDNGNESDDKRSDPSPHHKPHDFPKKSLGIDIGTTASKLAYRDHTLTEIVENKEGLRSTPAALYLSLDETSVGSYAYRQRYANPSKVAIGYHSLVGTAKDDPNVREYISQLNISSDRLENSSSHENNEISVLVGGTPVSASALYTHIAKDLYSTVQNKFDQISSVPTTLSLPNYYHAKQIQAAMIALQKSGLSCHQYVPDAVAALVGAHDRGYLPKSETVLLGKYLVLDIGGRMTQITVVDMKEKSYELIGTKTLFHVGGEYVNDVLATHITTDYQNKNSIQLLNDSFSKQRIYETIELLKIDLSKNKTSEINLPYITADLNGPKHLQMEISRANFEHLITPMFQRIQKPLTDLLTEINLQNIHEIKSFVVVGGGARIPLVQKMSKEMLGIEPIIPSQPEEIISLGASLYSSKYSH